MFPDVFKNLAQKTFFRFVQVVALLAFVGVFIFAVQMDEHNTGPSDLTVPFSEENFGKPILGDAGQDLSVPNMSARELAKSLNLIIAESLSLNKGGYDENVEAMRKYFVPAAYAQYEQFLKSAGFEAMILTQNMQSGIYPEQDPLELTNGVYDGVYKWVFEVPVMISFIPRSAQTYRNNETRSINRRFLLRVQFARVDDPQEPGAVKIEIWQVLPPRASE